MPPPRRSRRRTGPGQEPQLEAVQWPTLKATWEGLEPAELAERHARAHLLVTGGWGAIEPWLTAPPTPAEQGRQLELNSPFDVEAG